LEGQLRQRAGWHDQELLSLDNIFHLADQRAITGSLIGEETVLEPFIAPSMSKIRILG